MASNSQPPGPPPAPPTGGVNAPPPATGDELRQEVTALVAAGRHAEAAARARAGGDLGRAVALYEQIWDFAAATECARSAGDLPRALQNALDARAEGLVRTLIEELAAQGDGARRAAREVLTSRRRFAEAGRFAESLGDRKGAIALYRRGQLDVEAARLLIAEGEDHEAGRLLETLLVDGGSGPDAARAHLLLGQILAARLQHGDAVRHLQEAGRHPHTGRDARRALVVELARLGLRDAACQVLAELRSEEPELPAELDAFVAARAPTRASAGPDETQLVGGRYRIVQLLGAGASGRVYRARDEVSGREVALKMLSLAAGRGHPSYERFAREARIAASLHHPGLVAVLGFAPEHGLLVMEYLSGGSLADRLHQPQPGVAVRRLALELLDGLALAHGRGIIHRDIKPANIFFDARGNAKLGDFGVAHLLDLGQTQTGGLIGTLAYMSPEQITGAPLTAAADLYATGITLFQALTGRLPFLGPDFVAQHLGEAPIAPSEVAPSVDPAWDPLILQLLRKSPDERPASAHALRMAIEKLPLVERDPPPLLLPRGRPALPRGNAAVSTHGSGVEAGQERPRYQFETPLTITASSQLSRALDRYLDRSVIVERFTPPVDPRLERRLLDLAACAAPFLQRLLTWDPGAAVAVFEAPTGRPLDEVLRTGQPGPRELLRLLKGAARALGPLHERGVVHGQLDGQSIVIDEAGNPTLLIAGLPLPGTVQASADLRDLLHCTLRPQRPVDVDQLSELLCTAITAASDHGVTRRELRTAGDLYQLATTLETTLLRRQFFAGAAAPE